MAVEMITWARRQVFDQFALSGPERFILMLLADNASFDEETGLWSAFPFQNTLAQESGFNERTVQRALKRFRDLGLLSVEVRYKKAGGKSGNTYRFHPEAVNEPIARTEPTPDFSRDDRESGLENSRDDTESSMPPQAREFKTRQRVGYAGNGDHTRHTVGSHPTQSRVPRAETNAGASLTVIEPSSSSSGPSASTGEGVASCEAETDVTTTKTDHGNHETGPGPERLGTHRVPNARGPVDLDRLVAVVAGQWSVGLDRDRAVWLAEEITGRSARTVGSPDAFVRRSLVNDGHEWETAVIDHFGDRTMRGRSGGQRTTGDRKCPIPHHADSGWTARSCPGCRKQLDFPKQLDRSIYDAMEPDVRSLIDRDQTVTVVDMTEASVRSRDRHVG